MKTLNEQNQVIHFEVPNGFIYTKPITEQNNLYSLYCTTKNSTGDVYIKTYSGSVVNNEQIELYFDGTKTYEYKDLNIPIIDRVEVNNQSNNDVVCNILVNNYSPNAIQKDIQDYGLATINFLMIIFLWCLPFGILIFQLRKMGMQRIKQKLSFNKKQVGEK